MPSLPVKYFARYRPVAVTALRRSIDASHGSTRCGYFAYSFDVAEFCVGEPNETTPARSAHASRMPRPAAMTKTLLSWVTFAQVDWSSAFASWVTVRS